MNYMRIVVEKLPDNCNNCIFAKYEHLIRLCSLTEEHIDKCDEWGHRILRTDREEHCPLVEWNELLFNFMNKTYSS